MNRRLQSIVTDASTKAALGVCILLVGFIGYLVYSQYRSQVALQRSQLRQLAQNVETRAILAESFYSERLEDVRRLADSREIGIYFENKALGMSMEYGLHSSLDAVQALLDRLRQNSKKNGHPVFSQIVFIDKSEEVMSISSSFADKQGATNWKNLLKSDEEVVPFPDTVDGKAQMVVSVPLRFKNEFAGRVLAWIPLSLVYDSFVREMPGDVYTAISYGREYLLFPTKAKNLIPTPLQSAPPVVKPGQPSLFLGTEGGKQNVYVINSQVTGMLLTLHSFVPAISQFDVNSALLSLAMSGIMAVMILVGVYVVYSLNIKNSALKARLEETSLREEHEREAAVALRQEVAERIRIEETLRESEAEARQLNETLLVIRNVQHLVHCEHDVSKLLDGICKILVHRRGYLTVWVGKTELNSKKVIQAAHAGNGGDVLSQMPTTWDDSPSGQGPCGKAIRERVPVVFADITKNPRYALWADSVVPPGCASIASVPLIHNDRVFGAVTVNADGSHLFTQEEVDLLKGMADEVAHALQSMENEANREQAEVRLRQAQKMEAVGQLAGGVAHDFNNILATFLMQIDLMKEEPNLSLEMGAALEELNKGANRAASLTKQLLLFSRRQVTLIKPLDLNEVLSGVIKMLRRILGEHIDLTIHGVPEPIWIKADEGMIEQVVMNLCVNARDSMPKGGRLTIGTEYAYLTESDCQTIDDRRPGRFVCLSVTDTGCGMSEEIQKRIFEPFFTTKEVGKGTGLGLSIVYGIARQHRGWIEVQSKLGAGSVFRVFLPVSKRNQAAEPEPVVLEKVLGNECVLLVEDDAYLMKASSETLKRLGYEVLEAVDGVEAMEQWNRHKDRIALLLTDMVLPNGMNGLDLANQFRGNKPGLKVIISSGYSLDLIQMNTEEQRKIRFLAKPYQVAALASVVRKCLDLPLSE